MIDAPNEQRMRASASIRCEDPFSLGAPYAEELEHNVDILIHDQDIRQCPFPGDQILTVDYNHNLPTCNYNTN